MLQTFLETLQTSPPTTNSFHDPSSHSSTLLKRRILLKRLLSGSADSSIHIFDLEDVVTNSRGVLAQSVASASKTTGHKFSVTGANWFPFDTGLFTSSSMDGTVKVWDTNAMEVACTFNLNEKVYSHAMSPVATSHSLIAAASEQPRIRLCDMRTGAFSHTLTGHTASVFTVAWSPRDEYVLASGGADMSIRFWDIRKAKACVMSLDQHKTNTASPASETFSTSENLKGKKKIAMMISNAFNPSTEVDGSKHGAHTGTVNGLTFTSDGNYLLSTGHDESIRLWDTHTGAHMLINYGPHLHNKAPLCVLPTLTPLSKSDPPLIFHPSDNRQVLIYNLFSGDLVGRLRGHFARVGCAALRPFTEFLRAQKPEDARVEDVGLLYFSIIDDS
ncbi:DNA excision repair protein ERCC-8 [Chytridiales sp. JEL 0842]|nr:DNA excision repair protein ERCC-8 [Chytridiales sp. JEL 0842]